MDAEAQTLEAFGQTEETPRLVAAHAGEDTFRPKGFPGLEISLGEVWHRP